MWRDCMLMKPVALTLHLHYQLHDLHVSPIILMHKMQKSLATTVKINLWRGVWRLRINSYCCFEKFEKFNYLRKITFSLLCKSAFHSSTSIYLSSKGISAMMNELQLGKGPTYIKKIMPNYSQLIIILYFREMSIVHTHIKWFMDLWFLFIFLNQRISRRENFCKNNVYAIS